MLALKRVKYAFIASSTGRGRCEVLAESRYATPVSRKGKSWRMASTSNMRSELNVDIFALQAHRVGPGRDHRRQAGHGASQQVEAGAVGRALDLEAPELAVAQRVLLVRADVAEGVEGAVLRVRETDLLAVHHDLAHGVDLQLVQPGHRMPSQCGPPAPARPAPAPAGPGSGPGPRRRSRRRSSAPRWMRGCRGSADRRGARGRPAPRWRRACSARRV